MATARYHRGDTRQREGTKDRGIAQARRENPGGRGKRLGKRAGGSRPRQAAPSRRWCPARGQTAAGRERGRDEEPSREG